MKVIGVDLSLASTGVAVVTPGCVTTHTVTSKPTGDALVDRCVRLHGITAQLMDYVRPGPALVVIEGPAYSRTQGHQHERSGLWFIVVTACIRSGAHVVEISPTKRMKYATGKGQIAKDKVLAAVLRRYAGVDVDGNDQADALVLAAMGARAVGQPIEESLPREHLAAMVGIVWPELVAS
jgi:crossover junction endodeoxyribonuclease RuvC